MKKKVKATQEEIKKEHLDHELNDLLNNKYIPYPPSHMLFKVGDKVQFGNLKNSVVVEVFDNGRILLLNQTRTNNNYGRPYDTEESMYVSWIDISPYVEPENSPKIITAPDYRENKLSFYQRDLSGLLGTYYRVGIDMSPDYQRGDVWDMEDKISLISSIFQNVDIGKFVLIHLPFKEDFPSYEVLDGKQRIIALTEFYECKFKFKGMYYRELSMSDRNVFRGHSISCAEMENQRDQIKLSDKYKYFLRLNTGGKVQNTDHLKKVEEMYKKAIKDGK